MRGLSLAILCVLTAICSLAVVAQEDVIYTGETFDAGGATLRIAIWGGYWKEVFEKTVISDFERDFNCKVSYDGGWPWFPKFVAGGKGNPPHALNNWNLFQMSKAANAGDFFVDLEKIRANVPNSEDTWDFAWISGTGVTWQFGIHCLAYNKDHVSEPYPDSFEDFWDTRFDGQRATYISSNGLMPPFWMAAAELFGEGVNDLEGMRDAMEAAVPMKIVDFTGAMQTFLEKGEALIVEQYDSEMYDMLDRGVPLEIIWWPEGRQAILSQTFTVSKGLDPIEEKLAYAFINRILSPRYQYELCQVELGGRPTNKYVQIAPNLAKHGVTNTADGLANLWVPDYTWYGENEDEIVRMFESIFAQ